MKRPAAEPVVLALPNGTDVLVDLGVDRRNLSVLSRNGRGRSRHSAKIGIPAYVLDAREAENIRFTRTRGRDTPPE